MNDNEIIGLYFSRAETAIGETDKKYGAYCRSVAFNILGSREDSEECVNDTYLKIWNAIPPKKPQHLGAFIARTARNCALDMRDRLSAAKRGGKNTASAFEELSECLPSGTDVEKQADDDELTAILDRFLGSLGYEKRMIFMKRYWHFYSVPEIANEMHISESKVKTTLFRTREKLKKYLEKEGIDI